MSGQHDEPRSFDATRITGGTSRIGRHVEQRKHHHNYKGVPLPTILRHRSASTKKHEAPRHEWQNEKFHPYPTGGHGLMFTKMVALPGENFFTQVPTHWLRDPRASRGLKAVLSYWQSHAIGYRVTIEQTIAEMAEGRDAIYASVREGIDLGYLVRLQDRAARGRFGALEYTLGPAAFEQQYVRNWGRQPDGTEGPLIERAPGKPVAPPKRRQKNQPVDNPPPGDVSAGGTAYGSTGNGESVSGGTAYGEPVSGPSASGESATKKINPQKISSQKTSPEKDQKIPPPLFEGESLPRETSPPQGEDLSDSEKQLLSTAARQAAEARARETGWSMQAIIDAMQDQLTAGHSAAKVAAAMIEASVDKSTLYPGRIGHQLKRAALAAAPAPANAPEWAQGAMKYLDPETPRCRVKGHRAEPAIGCGKCKADAIAARLKEPEPALRPEESDELPEEERLTGAALARHVASAARTGRGEHRRKTTPPPPPSTSAAPAQAGALFAQVAARLDGAA